MSAAFKTIEYRKDGPLAWVILNRPDKVNAYNLQMRDDLWEVLFAIEADSEVKAAILCGNGERGFCAGADLSEFGTAPSQIAARRVRWERDVFGKLAALRVPSIAAVHGHVIGSGLELALLCDLRIAAADAEFSMPETGLGLIPAAGGTQTLARVVGVPAALDMILRGTLLGASSTLGIGLVGRVVDRQRLRPAAEALARKLASIPPDVLADVHAWRRLKTYRSIWGLSSRPGRYTLFSNEHPRSSGDRFVDRAGPHRLAGELRRSAAGHVFRVAHAGWSAGKCHGGPRCETGRPRRPSRCELAGPRGNLLRMRRHRRHLCTGQLPGAPASSPGCWHRWSQRS